MDFRQYDNALGRFTSVDLLAEESMSMTPYHFGNDNPNFWADPSGLRIRRPLNSGCAWLDEMWNQTPRGGSSSWEQDSGGNFECVSFSLNGDGGGGGGSGGDSMIGSWITNDGTFNAPIDGIKVALPELVIPKNISINSDRFWNIVEGHTYWNSPYYESWRTGQHEKQWGNFTEGIQHIGDGISSFGYALSLTGLGTEAGVPLMGLGVAISGTGTVLKHLGTAYYKHSINVQGAIIDGALFIVPRGYGNLFGNGSIDHATVDMAAMGSGYWFDYMNELNSQN